MRHEDDLHRSVFRFVDVLVVVILVAGGLFHGGGVGRAPLFVPVGLKGYPQFLDDPVEESLCLTEFTLGLRLLGSLQRFHAEAHARSALPLAQLAHRAGAVEANRRGGVAESNVLERAGRDVPHLGGGGPSHRLGGC